MFRNATLSGPSGHAGIELIDGVHHCQNAVTGPEGYAAAVLIRALQPVGNTEATGVARRHVGLDVHSAELLLTEPEPHVPIAAVARPRSGAEAEGPEITPAGGWNAPRGAPVRDRREKNCAAAIPRGSCRRGNE
jgi:hypothetical protein